MKTRVQITTAVATALLLNSVPTDAQQGPAELWVWDDSTALPAGPNGGNNGIRELDETTPAAGVFVSVEAIENAPEIEFAGDVFYNSTTEQILEIVDASTGLVDNTVALDFSGTITAATGPFPVGTALEVIGTTLYAGIVGDRANGGPNPSELATIDPITGVVTSIGLTGLDRPLGGLAYNGTMYAVNAGGADPANLYTIDLTTGAATLVGSTGVQLTGLEFGIDGVLYAVGRGDSNDVLFTIDPVTGTSTVIGGNLTGDFSGAGSITSSYIIPEPAAVALLGLGGPALLRRPG